MTNCGRRVVLDWAVGGGCWGMRRSANPGGITEGSRGSQRSGDLREKSSRMLCTPEGCQRVQIWKGGRTTISKHKLGADG